MLINYFIHETDKVKSSDLDIIRVNNYPGCLGFKGLVGYGIFSVKTWKFQANREKLVILDISKKF